MIQAFKRPLSLIAHRGGSLEAPENTVASVAHGIASGSDWQEIDVQLTADGGVVVMHDDTLERTTSGKGPVSAQTLAELCQLYAGAPAVDLGTQEELRRQKVALPTFQSHSQSHPQSKPTGPSIKVPSLQEILALPRARLMVELKPGDQPERLAAAVLELVAKHSHPDKIRLGSFQPEALEAVLARTSAIGLVGIVDSEGPDSPSWQRLLALPLKILAVDKYAAQACRAKAPAALPLWVWTVYSAQEALELSASEDVALDGLITDAPQAVHQALEALRH